MMLLSARAEVKNEWEKVRETSDGIVVYMRKTSGTTVKEIKVKLVIDAPPRQVLDAACDPRSFKKSVKYVEQNNYYWIGNPDVWFTYQIVKFPLITRRDYSMRYERAIDAKKGVYQLSWATSMKKGPGPQEDIIRVKLATGKVDVVSIDDGKKSLLKYRLLADPGGNIPGWVMNIANRINIPDIIREIRDSALLRAKDCAKGNCQLWNAIDH
ncbi:MAG: hypothetical protein GY854_05910 [Deltaproteobacteria bacterium]|nr:hypothetical protein [Deltaproteobacteria bacterium]